MKSTLVICILILNAATFVARGADELIPERLNKLLLAVTPGMTPENIERILSPSYPKLIRRDGPSSGQSGYIGFSLDGKLSVLFSGVYTGGHNTLTVSENPQISVIDLPHKVRFDITRHPWK
jgi:hypothetical protein